MCPLLYWSDDQAVAFLFCLTQHAKPQRRRLNHETQPEEPSQSDHPLKRAHSGKPIQEADSLRLHHLIDFTMSLASSCHLLMGFLVSLSVSRFEIRGVTIFCLFCTLPACSVLSNQLAEFVIFPARLLEKCSPLSLPGVQCNFLNYSTCHQHDKAAATAMCPRCTFT